MNRTRAAKEMANDRPCLRKFTIRNQSKLGKLVDARDGLAAIEFALLLPFLLILLFGIVEISNAYQIKQRIALTEYVLGDLVGRSTTLSGAQIDDIFQAADLLMAPYSSDPLTVNLRAIRLDDAGGASTLWSRSNDGSVPPALGPNDLDSGLGTGRDLIEIRVDYPYDFDLRLVDATLITFGQTAYVVPRAADLDSWNGN